MQSAATSTMRAGARQRRLGSPIAAALRRKSGTGLTCQAPVGCPKLRAVRERVSSDACSSQEQRRSGVFRPFYRYLERTVHMHGTLARPGSTEATGPEPETLCLVQRP